MPDIVSTLRQTTQWTIIIATVLTRAFYKIPHAGETMKYYGVVTPFWGVQVYVRSALGVPNSKTYLGTCLPHSWSPAWRVLCSQDHWWPQIQRKLPTNTFTKQAESITHPSHIQWPSGWSTVLEIRCSLWSPALIVSGSTRFNFSAVLLGFLIYWV